MAESVQLVGTLKVKPNPENPRLIFHQEELDALQESIKQQGILVPLTMYREGKSFRILDGERRWRCAVKLGLPQVPANIQAKPDRLTNLMMMFAIHHRRNEWDPLPTAMKLEALEKLYAAQHQKRPTELQLAELASLTRGEVRRYKKLMALPEFYRNLLLEELQKPRSKQVITVDVVLEATAAGTALRKRKILREEREDIFRRAIIDKFRAKVIKSTVDPRRFSKLARAVQRNEVPIGEARREVEKFISTPNYSIRQLFERTVEEVDFLHNVELLADRLGARVDEFNERGYELSDELRLKLRDISKTIARLLRK